MNLKVSVCVCVCWSMKQINARGLCALYERATSRLWWTEHEWFRSDVCQTCHFLNSWLTGEESVWINWGRTRMWWRCRIERIALLWCTLLFLSAARQHDLITQMQRENTSLCSVFQAWLNDHCFINKQIKSELHVLKKQFTHTQNTLENVKEAC